MNKKIALITALLFPCQIMAQENEVDITEFSIEQLMNVEVFTASRFVQNSKEAPSSVTVITSDDVKKYGYKTLADIINSIRGLFTSNDRNYSYLGTRGLSITGDYNSRILVLLDGQRVNENLYEAAAIGYDGIVNIDLIKRVEFAPGPGSAVYGSSAFSGVLNIITKKAYDIDGVQVSTDYGSENSRRLRVTQGAVFDNGVSTLFSASAYKSDGADLYFPEFDDPTTNFGVAEGLDYEESRNLFTKLSFGDWQLEAAYNDRIKGIPTASYGQEFNTRPSETIDSLLLVSLSNESLFKDGSSLSSSLSYGNYSYTGDYIYDYPPLTINKDDADGRWWRIESRYQTTLFERHKLLLGAEYQGNFRQNQANFDAPPFFASYLDDKRDSRSYAFFAQDEIRLTDKLLLNIGIRHDATNFGATTGSATEKNSTNPRVALIYAMQQQTTLKLIYGTAFRNPSAYELYSGSASGYLLNPGLKPENIKSYELDLEHYFSNKFKLTAALFYNDMTDMIGINSDINGDLFFDNINKVKSKGAELETEYIDSSGLRLRASYSYTKTEDQLTGESLPNSPNHLAKVNMTLPVFNRMADLGVELQFASDRKLLATKNKPEVEDYMVTNLTLFSNKLSDNLELTASIYNVFDRSYSDPAFEEHTQDTITQDGRSYRLKASYTF